MNSESKPNKNSSNGNHGSESCDVFFVSGGDSCESFEFLK